MDNRREGRSLRAARLPHPATREWAYDRNSSVGRLDKALDEANAKGWTARWCMNTRTLTVIPDGKAHIARTKAELAILMPER
jgi:hypothetical protein